jgi:adenylate cyclase
MTKQLTLPIMTNSTEPIGIILDVTALAPSELRVVLVCDVVESVRWMEQDEENAVTRWQAFTQLVRSTIAPTHNGSVVKSTGDGMLIEFPTARDAVQAAAAMHAAAAADNMRNASATSLGAGQVSAHYLQLRTGIHETLARRDAHDLYGHGVNLAARITTLAGPGETIISAPVRDHLTDSLDGDIEDMGECYLKHVSEPHRVYRVGTASAQPILVPQREYAETLQPTIAVIPFEARSNEPEHFAIGELIADGVIAQLSQSSYLRIVSRLSTSRLRGRPLASVEAAAHISADYSVIGSYAVMGNKIVVIASLIASSTNTIVASERITAEIQDLVAPQSEVCHKLSLFAHSYITNTEVAAVRSKPVPTVHSFGLLLVGIDMMNRPSLNAFEESIHVFDHLVERHTRNSTLRAWRAKWRLWKIMSGLSHKPGLDIELALADAKTSLDIDDTHPLSLAVYGQICNQLLDRPDDSLEMFDSALARSPSESLAWLFKSVHSSMWGDAAIAVAESHKAYALSRLDPNKYILLMAIANAQLANHEHHSAIESAIASLRCNAIHAPTLRILLTAYVETGQMAKAHQTFEKLLMVQPDICVSSYRAMGSNTARTRQRFLYALSRVSNI